jgi:hypothetical protein
MSGSPNQVTWTNDIKDMFTPTDILHMQGKGYDLSSYAFVKNPNVAAKILAAVTPPDPSQPASPTNAPSMPPQSTSDTPWWTQEMINTFTMWMQQGYPQ